MKIILSFMLAILINLSPAEAGFREFAKRGFQHCSGYCDEQHIDCTKGINKQGSYDWCKKNCLHDSKKNRNEFVNAIAKCDATHSGSSGTSPKPATSSYSQPAALPDFSKSFLGQISQGDAKNGFLIKIVAQKESGTTAQSGELVYLHPDKVQGNLQIGDYVEMSNITSKELPAYNYGKAKLIKDVPTPVK